MNKFLYKSIGFNAIVEIVNAWNVRTIATNQVKVRVLKVFPKHPDYVVPIEGHVTWLSLSEAKIVQDPNELLKELV